MLNCELCKNTNYNSIDSRFNHYSSKQLNRTKTCIEFNKCLTLHATHIDLFAGDYYAYTHK